MITSVLPRPYTSVIVAMSADGKIADYLRSPARFGSNRDRHHLEQLISQMDAVLLGGNTLRAYGSSLLITDPQLLIHRQTLGQLPQPFHIICSGSGQFDVDMRFFQQPLPRWLLTTPMGARYWQPYSYFDSILPLISGVEADWTSILYHLGELRLRHIAVLGGGRLIASLLAQDCIDELQITLCPLLLGGETAPSPVGHPGFLASVAPRLKLLSVNAIADEVFLHYRLCRP